MSSDPRETPPSPVDGAGGAAASAPFPAPTSPAVETGEAGAGGRSGARRPPPGPARRLYQFLVSPKLAIALLVGVLACCIVGVTVLRDARAWELIFSTLWFNALLVVLALSSGAAFFTRIWRRKLTLVSAGMILFHLSFMALLGGVVFNGLFFFRGVLRLTEGETLPNGAVESYDLVEHGRLFTFDRLQGETTLVRMHRGYKVEGEDKRAAYEIAVGQGEARTTGVIYITRDLTHRGVRYLCSKEGYSVLLVLSEKDGRESYGAHVPLQSLRKEDGGFVYATGSAAGPEPFGFPAAPEHPRADLLVTFLPSLEDRKGLVGLEVKPLGAPREALSPLKLVPVGGQADLGDFLISPREIRYWVGMDVRYDPGLYVILGSLCFGLLGMVMTFAGRVRQGTSRRPAAEAQ